MGKIIWRNKITDAEGWHGFSDRCDSSQDSGSIGKIFCEQREKTYLQDVSIGLTYIKAHKVSAEAQRGKYLKEMSVSA